MQPAKKTRVVTVTLYGRHAEWIERRIKDLEDQGHKGCASKAIRELVHREVKKENQG